MMLTIAQHSRGNIIEAKGVSAADIGSAIRNAKSGDTVRVPAGTAHWNSTLTIERPIVLEGAGAGKTVIIDDVVGKGKTDQAIMYFKANAYCRLTGFTFGCGDPKRKRYYEGTVLVDHGLPNFRIDHCDFSHLRNKAIGVHAERGVIDHNTFEFLSDGGVIMYGTEWGGGDKFGDTSWAKPLELGSDHAVFIEDNTFVNESLHTNATNQTCTDAAAGARWVFRYNTVTDTWIGCHGSESTGRFRGNRSMEVYHNTFKLARLTEWFTAIYFRSGTGVVWGNTFTGNYRNIAQGQNYRDTDRYFWGGADGVNPWDLNDTADQTGNGFGGGRNGVYASGVHTGPDNSQELIVENAGWKTDQWHRFTIRNVDTNRFSLIRKNTSDTLNYKPSVNKGLTFNHGQRFEIRRVNQVLDHPGGSTTDLLTGDAPGPHWLNQTIDPIYLWNNTLNDDPSPKFAAAGNIMPGRDFVENTERPGYKPYIYPHPLVSGKAGGEVGANQ